MVYENPVSRNTNFHSVFRKATVGNTYFSSHFWRKMPPTWPLRNQQMYCEKDQLSRKRVRNLPKSDPKRPKMVEKDPNMGQKVAQNGQKRPQNDPK